MYQNDGHQEGVYLSNMWNQLRRILEEAGIEGGALAESIMEDVETNKTQGKAEPFDSGGSGHGSGPGYCNAIPGHPGASCHRHLWVKCYNRDNLSERLREMIYHAGVYCPDDNKEVIFVTTHWDDKIHLPHRQAIDCLKRKGVRFAFVLISANGMGPIYI